MRRPAPLAERFARKWRPDEATGCWLWVGHRSRKGYGLIGVMGGVGRSHRGRQAHRVSWELHVGPIPDGMMVCHRCDIPACVRPDHLFLGTGFDNMRDARDKRRLHNPPGERSPHARLTDAQVREVIARYAAGGVSYRALAAEYGVSHGYVGHLVHGLSRRRVAVA